jgi:hypothetical protein
MTLVTDSAPLPLMASARTIVPSEWRSLSVIVLRITNRHRSHCC